MNVVSDCFFPVNVKILPSMKESMEIVISLFISIYLSLQKTFLYFTVVYLVWQISFFQFSSVLWWGWLSNRKNIPCENIYGSLIPKCVFMANQDQPHVTAEDKAGQTMSMGVCYVCVLLNGANVFELRFSLRTSFYLLYLFGRWTAVIGNFRRWTIFWTYVICIHVFTEIK